MMSTDFQAQRVGTTTGKALEQCEQAGAKDTDTLVARAEVQLGVLADTARPAAAVEVSEMAGGIGAPLLVGTLSGLALTLAVFTPVPGVRIAGLVIAAVTVLIVCRLLVRRGGVR